MICTTSPTESHKHRVHKTMIMEAKGLLNGSTCQEFCGRCGQKHPGVSCEYLKVPVLSASPDVTGSSDLSARPGGSKTKSKRLFRCGSLETCNECWEKLDNLVGKFCCLLCGHLCIESSCKSHGSKVESCPPHPLCKTSTEDSVKKRKQRVGDPWGGKGWQGLAVPSTNKASVRLIRKRGKLLASQKSKHNYHVMRIKECKRSIRILER